MKIEPFGVELWMNEWETKCQWNLAETCVESITVEELLRLTGTEKSELNKLLPMKMTYGSIEGSDRLRNSVAATYDHQTKDNVIITHGTIGANMLAHKTLVSSGDRVVAVVPTYQQHYSIPSSIGAEVHQLTLSDNDGWLPDLNKLRKLVSPGTRLLALNNPNNPTGALMDRSFLEEVVEIAREANAWLLCDEVYRGTDQTGMGSTVSIADLYEKGISTASVSKAYSLAGLRLGWIVGSQEFIEEVVIHRDYDTISVGMINDHFASIALEHSNVLLERSQNITRNNLAVLESWVEQEPLISWVKPNSGTTALLKYDLLTSSRELCVELLKDTGVMLTPGSALGMEGYLRIGYANNPSILKEGLAQFSEFLLNKA